MTSNDSCLFSHSLKGESPSGYQHCQALARALPALGMATNLLSLHTFLVAPRDRQTPRLISYKDTNPAKGPILLTHLEWSSLKGSIALAWHPGTLGLQCAN